MRTVAILLCLICAGYYGWEAFEGWLVEPQKPVQKSSAQAEVFPSAMQHIVPIDDLENYVKQERLAASEEKKALEEKQREAEELAKQEKQLVEAKKAEPLPIPIPQPQKETGITEETVCFRMGPLSTKALPSINRSIEKAGLLETVRVESVLSADSYVIFIIPTTTLKGAEALMKQVKKQGYPSARVIESGPLMNAVQLGEFSDPDRAQTFFEEALNKLKMNDIRLTRLIGEPSGKVHLIFSSLSEQQTRALKNVAQKHGQHLYNCQF